MKFQNNAKLGSIVGGDFAGGEVTRYRSVRTVTAINLPFFTAAKMFSATTQNTLSSSSVRVHCLSCTKSTEDYFCFLKKGSCKILEQFSAKQRKEPCCVLFDNMKCLVLKPHKKQGIQMWKLTVKQNVNKLLIKIPVVILVLSWNNYQSLLSDT